MAHRVTFKTKRGKRISFTAGKRRKSTRKSTPYTRFMRKELKKCYKADGKKKGTRSPRQVHTIMKTAAKAWSRHK